MKNPDCIRTCERSIVLKCDFFLGFFSHSERSQLRTSQWEHHETADSLMNKFNGLLEAHANRANGLFTKINLLGAETAFW